MLGYFISLGETIDSRRMLISRCMAALILLACGLGLILLPDEIAVQWSAGEVTNTATRLGGVLIIGAIGALGVLMLRCGAGFPGRQPTVRLLWDAVSLLLGLAAVVIMGVVFAMNL